MRCVLVSVSAEYPAAGEAELRTAWPGAQTQRLGADLVAVTAPGVRIGALAEKARGTGLVFCKHLAAQIGVIDRGRAGDLDAAAAAAVALLRTAGADDVPGFAVRAWAAGKARLPYRPGGLAARVAAELEPPRSVSAGRDWTCSLVICDDDVRVGWNHADDGLSDWPGGRVRLARRPEQVSRAEFKLEELFKLVPLSLPTRGRALDLGASPGGWTRILRTRGFDVTAVDPGELAPTLAADRCVRHVRTTAGQFLRGSHDRFDCIVNDMRMDPDQAVRTMLTAASRLRPGGLMISTLKLGAVKNPLPVVNRALTRLAGRYDLQFARQLHHNRHEITVVGRGRRQ
jgi:23S rRNA (cytidine2498-2'-O)-methyltransferase